MGFEPIILAKGAIVEKQLEPLSRRQLSLRMLSIDPALTAPELVDLLFRLLWAPQTRALAVTALTALLTSLLSVIVYMVIARFNGSVKKPAQPVYAITR